MYHTNFNYVAHNVLQAPKFRKRSKSNKRFAIRQYLNLIEHPDSNQWHLPRLSVHELAHIIDLHKDGYSPRFAYQNLIAQRSKGHLVFESEIQMYVTGSGRQMTREQFKVHYASYRTTLQSTF